MIERLKEAVRAWLYGVVNAVGIDRVAHAALCALVTVMAALVMCKVCVAMPSWLAGVCGAVCALCIGNVKEAVDVRVDRGDLLADAVDSVFGMLLCRGLL